VRNEFSQNRYYILYIRYRYNLSPLLFLENQPAFSPSRKSDPDYKFKVYALEFKDYIFRIIAFVTTSSNLGIRSLSKYKMSFVSLNMTSLAGLPSQVSGTVGYTQTNL
jgi:hypothetical protein